MRILVHDYAGHPFQVGLSRRLAERGHQVTHAYFVGDPGPKGALEGSVGDPDGLTFRGIAIDRQYDKGAFLSRRLNDLRYGRAAAQAIDEIRPDVVISGNTPTPSQAFVVRAAKKSGAAFVFWMQDFYSVAATKLLRKRLGRLGSPIGALYRNQERRQLAASDQIVVITEDFKPQAAVWAGAAGRVTTIENWGAIAEIGPAARDNAFAREHGLAGGFNFLYSGTLGLKHNPDLLIGIARSFAGRARMVVVGQGLGVGRLHEAKQQEGLDNLVVLPVQPFSRLPELLATADVCVSVIEHDAGIFSVPSKIQSYLCAARPILLAAPAENLAARIVVREEAGLVVDPLDQSGFITLARRIFEDADLRRRLATNGRSYAERAFDIDTVADRFERVLTDAVQHRRR